jgi:two-component system sensor histidine kinase RegB
MLRSLFYWPAAYNSYMPILPISRPLLQHQLLLRLCWMRCVATLAQALLVASAVFGMQLPLPLTPLCTVLGLMLLFNSLTWWRTRRDYPVREPELFLQLFLDVSALSALLYFTGGATNPFVSFFLPALAVASAILPSRYAIALALYSLLCYSALSYLYEPLHIHDPSRGMAYHLAGMWINFLVSAALITWFVTRMSATVRERDNQLAQARELKLQDDRIVALGTQAASAAHEMSTPLATVAVIAGELRIEAGRNPALALYREDLDIIEQQIDVCKTALERMSMEVHAPHAAGDAPLNLDGWLRQLLDSWRLRHPALVIRLSLSGSTEPVREPQLLGQIMLTLLDNAARAVAENGKIEVLMQVQSQELQISVNDDGPGIAPDLLKRLGYEPVRSSTGGKGIGLMLACATARQIGGRLVLSSPPAQGVQAFLRVPLDCPAAVPPTFPLSMPSVPSKGRKSNS